MIKPPYLVNDDCLNVMPQIPDGYFDLTVTSPPYDNLRTYNDSLEWGEHVSIEAVQRLYKRPIIVITSTNNPIIPENLNEYEGSPIFLYYNGHNHYENTAYLLVPSILR